jgi:transcriptional regulator with XRE-family HTH domain
MDRVGSILKKKREELEYGLDQVSEDTKIRRKYLEAIENGTYNQIPGPVYTRSFLRIYADYLGLDQVFIVKRYLDEIAPEETIKEPAKNIFTSIQSLFQSNLKWMVIIVIVALVVGFSVWGITSWVFSNRNTVQTPSSISSEEENTQPYPPDITETPFIDEELTIPLEESLEKIDEISYTEPFFDKLIVDIVADTANQRSCWVKPVVDGVTKNAYTLKNTINRASYECDNSFQVHLGNAGIISLRINGFSVNNIGENGEVISLDILLEPEQYILMDTLKGGIVVDTRRFEKNIPQP